MPTQQAVARAPAKERVYVVKKGDTVAAIARRSGGCSIRDIANRNALRAPHYPVKPGQALRLPSCAR